MSKVRVEDLATELGLAPEELFSQLKAMGFDVVNVTSSVDRSLVEMVEDMLVGKPAERDTGMRRIVSVRKGANETEVEVRLEEELPAEDEISLEEETPADGDAGELDESAAPGDAPGEEGSQDEEGKPSTGEASGLSAGVVETGEIPDAEAPANEEKPSRTGLDGLPMTALEIERELGSVGSVIPTAKIVTHAAPKAEPEVDAPAESKDEKGAPPKKIKTQPESDERSGKRPTAKKSRKPSRKELLEVVDELEVTEEIPPEPAEQEPTLKVVEIKRPGAVRQGRRREPPKRRPRGVKKKKKEQEPTVEMPKAPAKIIRITPGLTVGGLAGITGTKASEIIKVLLQLGIMATINQTIEPETASLVAGELGFEVEIRGDTLESLLEGEEVVPGNLVSRPPVVTVMGHVDHGKTSLLDAIRQTDVVSGEAGGITQHIGAHVVSHAWGELVFLDTPGHEAFTAMRSRGAQVTDLVVLVVAADDGVKPQTVEAIDHAKAAGVPIVVAINKVDKPDADPDRVLRELSEHGVVVEEWGGDVLYTKVSAKKKTGMEDLLDMILLQTEMLELQADPTTVARGTVIESRLDKGRGPIATVLVSTGTLRRGDLIVAGAYLGHVRVLVDDKGRKVEEAGPATPVEVVGLPNVPMAGESLIVFVDEMKAKRVAQMRQDTIQAGRGLHRKVSLEDLFNQIQDGEVQELNIVLKADVQGSVEAIREALEKQATDAVRVHIIHEAAGGINEGDVVLASASNAIIIGFNVRPDSKALDIARRENVDVRFYRVIYDVVKEIRDAMKGLLAPVYREEILGRAEVRQTFVVPKIGTIAGSYVTDGVIRRNAPVRVIRDGIVIKEEAIDSLKRFKDDAREVAAGFECGIGISNFNDLKQGDILENFQLVEEEATL